jgi:amidase
MVIIEELTIAEVHASYQRREYTCRQLVEAYLERIRALDQVGPCLNAIVTLSRTALEEADVLDAYLKEHGRFSGTLHGIPIIVKDQCDTAGTETTYGNILCKHVPTKDATLVRKLKEAGAVILAKSTMPGTSTAPLRSKFFRLTNR